MEEMNSDYQWNSGCEFHLIQDWSVSEATPRFGVRYKSQTQDCLLQTPVSYLLKYQLHVA